jgi:hypothetical protein
LTHSLQSAAGFRIGKIREQGFNLAGINRIGGHDA